jgi:hypothetical protein
MSECAIDCFDWTRKEDDEKLMDIKKIQGKYFPHKFVHVDRSTFPDGELCWQKEGIHENCFVMRPTRRGISFCLPKRTMVFEKQNEPGRKTWYVPVCYGGIWIDQCKEVDICFKHNPNIDVIMGFYSKETNLSDDENVYNPLEMVPWGWNVGITPHNNEFVFV